MDEGQQSVTTFQYIAQAVHRTMKLPVCVWTLDEPSQSLRIIASVDLPGNYVEKACIFLAEPSVTGEAFTTGQVAETRDILHDNRWKYKQEAQDAGWQSALCVPIHARGLVQGVISIYEFKIHSFTDAEKRLLLDYAAQIEAALDAEARRKLLQRIVAINSKFGQLVPGGTKPVLEEIAGAACEVIGADCAVIYPYDAAREEFYDLDSVAYCGLEASMESLKDKPRRSGLGAFIVRQGELVHSNIKQEDLDLLKSRFIARERIEAFMGIALKIADRVLGILYVNFRSPHRFGDEEKDAIRLFAQQAAIAIDNSRLYQQSTARAQAIKKLHEIVPTAGRLSGRAMSLRDILQQIAESAQQVLGADLVDLYEYVQNKDRYVLPPVEVGQCNYPAVRNRVLPDDVVAILIRGRKPRYVVEAQEAADLTAPFVARPDVPVARFVIREKIRSTAAIPLLAQDEIVGILFANYRIPQTFPDHQKQLIELFAGEAAIAVRNARWFEERGELERIGRDLTSIRNRDDLLQSILARSLNLLECEIGSICLLDRATNTLEFQYAVGKECYRSVPFGKGLIGTAAETRRPVRVGDVTQDPRYIMHVSETRSELDVPLIAGDELIGVLNAESTRYNAFDEDAEELALILAGQAAAALYNAMLLDQRRALEEIAASLTSELDTDALLEKILNRALELFHCPVGSIATFDNSTGQLVYRHAIGKTKGQSLPVDRGLMMAAAQTREPVRVNNVKQDSRYVADVAETRSELDVPMAMGDHVFGVLNLESPHENDFSGEDVKLAMALANQAAIAIENSGLYGQVQTRAEALKKLHQTIPDLLHMSGAPGSLQAILAQITQNAQSVLGADLVDLYQYTQNRNEFLLPPIQVGQRVDPSVRKSQIYEDDVVCIIVQSKQPLYLADSQQESSPLTRPFTVERPDAPRSRFVFREGIKSTAAVPLIVRAEVVGVLFANYRTPQVFSQHQCEIIELFAGQVAIAIRNARLFEQRRALQDIARDITCILDRDELLQKILARSLELLGCEFGSICLLNKTTNQLEFKYAIGKGQDLSVPYGEGLTSVAAETRRPIRSGDVTQDHRYIEHVAAIRSELDVPLLIGDELIGVLNAESAQYDAFDEESEQLAITLAGQAAAAIRNARLYQATQTINEMSLALTGGIRLREHEVLELIREQASKLMDTDNMYIALYDDATDTVRFGLAFVGGERVDIENEKGWQPRQAGKGRTEEIIRTRQQIFTATKAEAEAWYAQPGRQEYVGTALASWLGVPMMTGDKVLGVIATYHPTRDYVYSKDDLENLQAMAHQAAIAIDNARLYYDVNQRLAALVEVGKVVTSGIRVEEHEVLELIRDQAGKLMNTDNMYIALYDEPTDTVRFELAWVDGKCVDTKVEPGWQPRKGGKGRTEWIIDNRESIWNRTQAEGAAWYDQPGHKEYTGRNIWPSWLGVPMMTHDKVLGAIAVYDLKKEFAYSRDDLEVLSSMASQAAIAIENARLYQETERLYKEAVATKQLAQLATLGTAMAALQHRINNTFNIIVPNIMRLRNRVDMSDPTIAEILTIIERNARYTSDIIRRIQEPLQKGEIQEVKVNAVLTEVVNSVKELRRTDSTQPPVTIVLNLDDSIPVVQAPIGQITEVFRNLIDNACRVMPKGGQITVTSQLADDLIQVRVQDTGPGVPLPVQQRLFVKPVPSKDPGGGAGLGLWLSRLMLHSLGGDVTIERSITAEVGAPTGTTMLVKIPAPRTGKEV